MTDKLTPRIIALFLLTAFAACASSLRFPGQQLPTSPSAATPTPEPVLTVKDADTPVGPCDLGELVRAVRVHLSLAHPAPTPAALVLGITADYRPCRDYGWNEPRCKLEAAKAAVVEAEALVKADSERVKALENLRDEVSKCAARKESEGR